MTGLGAEQEKDLLQPVRLLRSLRGDGKVGSPKRVGDVGEEFGGHLVGRQHKIHHAGGDGAAGHAVVLGGFGCLRHHHAALALHRPDAQGAVAARAGEHNADGALVLVLGQGAEEKIDGQPDAAGQGGFQQLQRAVHKRHIAIGRDDVSAVRLDHHSVLDLEDLHPGIAPDQLGKDALVVPGQMLHQNKSHARIVVGGHGGEESFERRQSPGRRADADDREFQRCLARVVARPALD